MNTLVFATNNQHKLDEVQAMIGNTIQLKTLKEINCLDEIPETGNTFQENASQKSRFIFERYGLDCFSDDSGLEVDFLNGDPGVNTAHYSGTRDSVSNMQHLLSQLGSSPNRNARFRCVISLILDGKEYFFEGVAEGSISNHLSGTSGFGYDPIFIPEGYNRTYSELSASEKNSISHRGKAIQALSSFLSAR